MQRPGIEPGPPAWQARILPLNQRCLWRDGDLFSCIPMMYFWGPRAHEKHLLQINRNLSVYIFKQRWFSGRILACHAGGPGSIPGRCKFSFHSFFLWPSHCFRLIFSRLEWMMEIRIYFGLNVATLGQIRSYEGHIKAVWRPWRSDLRPVK